MAAERRLRASPGFTLAEIVISTLILAIGAVTVFAVAMTYRQTMKRTVYREEMNHYSRRILEELKAYVTADVSMTVAAPVNPTTGLPSWAHPNDQQDAACPTCCPQGRWALDNLCEHNVTSMLPAYLSAPWPTGVNAKLLYDVTVDPQGRRQVLVKMHWEEHPQ